jgi:hypothetical protein
MATPIRYEGLYMHSKVNQTASASIKKYMFENNIAFVDLVYTDENKTETLSALSTWFEDSNGAKIVFNELPVLTYDTVYWESDDKTHKYAVRNYVVKASDIPSDFATLAVKNS